MQTKSATLTDPAKKRGLGKGYDQPRTNDYRREKREYPLENNFKGNISCHTVDHIYIHPYRRRDDAHLHDQDHNDAEPNRIKTQADDDRNKDGHREQYHGQRIHDAPQNQKNENDNQ